MMTLVFSLQALLSSSMSTFHSELLTVLDEAEAGGRIGTKRGTPWLNVVLQLERGVDQGEVKRG